jgi:hypothetical protein
MICYTDSIVVLAAPPVMKKEWAEHCSSVSTNGSYSAQVLEDYELQYN